MQIQDNRNLSQSQDKPARPNPNGFVMSIALTLFVLTLCAVITMHYASRFNWQLM